MASIATNRFKQLAFTAGVNLSSDDIRVLIVNDTHTANPDHNFVSEITANELSGTGYARKALASISVTEDDTNDVAFFDADDVTYSAINAGEMAWAIIYKQVTTDADSPVLFELDIANVTTNGGDVTLQWNASGIVEL